ncbi:MAG TPA: hypothetical protein VLD57_07560, partial [Blastocatellia bacterium]|nr:hypothetical protein [Blastocatellia bacterium]
REFDARTGEWTGKRELYGPIAHDIGISFELEKGEALKFVSEGQELWSTAAYAGQFRRFDIELPADNSTADLYYRDAIKLGEANYWLPNQGGDPPPTWTHGGPGGGGG